MEVNHSKVKSFYLMDETTDKRLLPSWLWQSDNSKRLDFCKRAITKAMETCVSPVQRKRLELYYGQGLSKTEIARLENSTCSAVVKSLRSAQEAIREYAETYMEIYDSLERELLNEDSGL